MFARNSKRVPWQVVVCSIVIEATTESTVTASRPAIRQAAFGEGMQMAAVLVAIRQILCVFPFLQRRFLKGGESMRTRREPQPPESIWWN